MFWVGVYMNRLLVVLLVPVLLIACGGDDDAPSATATVVGETPRATVTVAPATATNVPATATVPPQATATPGVPTGTTTGDAVIDRIIAVMLAGDVDGIASVLGTSETPCTTAQGLGGPPKCDQAPGRPANGSLVRALPFSTCEGGWTYDLKLHATLLVQNKLSLYGVARFSTPQPPYTNETGYPTMEQMVLFEFSAGGTPRIGLIAGVTDGKVVYTRHICVGPPEEALRFYGPAQMVLRGPAYQ